MLGERSRQCGMFEADHLYLDFVGEDTFYGFLARHRGELFRDEAFAMLYCLDNGRASVSPSLLALALLLQAHDRVSDAEAKARADYDLRWKVALGIEVDTQPFAKSTLQLFRGQLILHDAARAIFERSLEYARESGYLKGRKIKVALDTTHILGRGAVKDTCSQLGLRGQLAPLLSDGYLPQPVQQTVLLQKLAEGNQHSMVCVGDRPSRWRLAHRWFLHLPGYCRSALPCKIASESTSCALIAQSLR